MALGAVPLPEDGRKVYGTMSEPVKLDFGNKTDDELLEMWANQVEYVGEVTEGVGAEIKRRRLDASSVHVATADEIEEDRDAAVRLAEMRKLKFGLGLLALVLVLAAFSAGELIGFLGMLLAGILASVAAIGLWRRREWGLVAALVVCIAVALWNVPVAVLKWSAVIGHADSGSVVRAVERTLAMILSARLAFRIHAFRKKGASAWMEAT